MHGPWIRMKKRSIYFDKIYFFKLKNLKLLLLFDPRKGSCTFPFSVHYPVAMVKDWSKGNTNVSSPHLGIEPSFFMKSTCSTTSPEDQVNGRDYVPEGLFRLALQNALRLLRALPQD